MAQRAHSSKTDVARQVKIGLRLGALAVALLVLLFMCMREPLRRLTLHHPRFEAQTPWQLPFPLGVIAAGNLDGDSYTDLVIASTAGREARFTILAGTADGPDLQNPIDLPNPFPILDLVLADLNGDGLDDMLATGLSEQTRAVALWWNEGRYSMRRGVARVPLRLIDVIDENQDGQPELVGITRDFDEIRAHTVAGEEVDSRPNISDNLYDTSVRDIAAAHLDASNMDLAIVAGNRIRLLRSGGLIPDPTTYFNMPPTLFAGQRLSPRVPSVAFQDLNGDGRADLAHIDAESVVLHLGLGGGDLVASKHPIGGQPAEWLVAGDFNGDGITDLITVAPDGMTAQTLLGQ